MHGDSRPLADRIRRTIIEEAKRAHKGHIGSALSVADLLAALYGGVLQGVGSDARDRDRFILAKGHAALALYAALHLVGSLSQDELRTYCADDSLLGVHPEHRVAGIDFCTGSLGQGLPIGAGCALAARLQGSSRRAFVLMSDAECNEGSVWEAAAFAAHHRLANLIAILDMNGQQALGHTPDVLDMEPMARRWAAFGWDVHEVDGHDADGLRALIWSLDTAAGPPHAIVARTVFGRGVSFMEGQIKWHYWPLSDEEYGQALAEIEARR